MHEFDGRYPERRAVATGDRPLIARLRLPDDGEVIEYWVQGHNPRDAATIYDSQFGSNYAEPIKPA